LCGWHKIARNPSRKPWDFVQDELAEVKILIWGVKHSSEKDSWRDVKGMLVTEDWCVLIAA
jgi:hypothetical protein